MAAGQYTSAVLTEHEGLFTLVPAADPWLGRLTFLDGTFASDLMTALVDRATHHLGRCPLKGRTVVDVGANIGSTTLRALHVYDAETVVAIEPHPGNLHLLRANLALNEMTDRVRVVEAAASDTAGTTLLDIAAGNQGDHQVVGVGEPPPAPHPDHPGDFIQIRAAPLDTLIERRRRPGMLWIDAQGHDGRVLAGARRSCRRSDCCVVEYWPLGIGRQPGGLDAFDRAVADTWPLFADVEDLLAGRGALHETGELHAWRARYPPDGSHTDLLLLHRSA
jgi:FkbM family methyltransferase